MTGPAPPAAFRYGERLSGPLGSFVLERRELPPLALPTGRLVACDPMVEPNAPALAAALPPGHYPVELGVAHFPNGDQRVAFATLRVRAEAPTAWRPAHFEGQDPSALQPGDLPGFGVDSATAAYFDASARDALLRWAEDDAEWYERVAEQMERTYVHTWSWAAVPLPGEAGLNLLAFSSGMGDGFYTTSLGDVADGTACCVVTDFGLADAPRAPHDGGAAPRPWWKVWGRD